MTTATTPTPAPESEAARIARLERDNAALRAQLKGLQEAYDVLMTENRHAAQDIDSWHIVGMSLMAELQQGGR